MSPPVSLVLCMAGHYRRFREQGYRTPKFLLPLRGAPLLTWIVAELRPERLLLVGNQRDHAHQEAVRRAVEGAELTGEVRFLEIGDTSGQAETADLGAAHLQQLQWSGPLIFHNVDTILRGRSLPSIGALLQTCDGYIDVFDHDSPAFSYVRLDGTRVVEIREKEVISSHATTGLYGFASPTRYRAAAAATSRRSRGEFYISDVYRAMLDQGADIRTDPSGEGHETLVLGTPAEYEAAVRRSQA